MTNSKSRRDDCTEQGAPIERVRGAQIDIERRVIRLVKVSRQSRLAEFQSNDDARMSVRQSDLEEADIAADLVNRIGDGDSAAENELVARYTDRLRYVLLRKMAQYPHDVDDVLQETLTTTLLRLRDEGIEEPARLGGFIYGIAKNLCRVRLRDHARHDGDSDPDALSVVPDNQLRPDQVLQGSETTRIVRHLLAELGNSKGSIRDREVLSRLYIMQQSREEVIKALDIDSEHLRRVVHRAKRRLKELLLESVNRDALLQVSDE